MQVCVVQRSMYVRVLTLTREVPIPQEAGQTLAYEPSLSVCALCIRVAGITTLHTLISVCTCYNNLSPKIFFMLKSI